MKICTWTWFLVCLGMKKVIGVYPAIWYHPTLWNPFILNEGTMYVPGFNIPPTAARISGSAIHQSIAYYQPWFIIQVELLIINKYLENPHILLFIRVGGWESLERYIAPSPVTKKSMASIFAGNYFYKLPQHPYSKQRRHVQFFHK